MNKREAWHKFSCPESLSNNGSMKSNNTNNTLHKTIEDYEVLELEFMPGKEKPQFEKYREDYQIVREKKSHHSFLMKTVCFFFCFFCFYQF